MKALFLSCLIGLFCSCSVSSQNHACDKVFDRYADKDGFLTVKFSNLPAEMLHIDSQDSDLILNSLRILTVNDEGLNKRMNFYSEIVPGIDRSGYEELMSVKHNGEKSILLCKKDRKRITEVLFVSGGDNNVLVEVTGSMSLEQAKKIAYEVTDDNHAHNEEVD